MSRSRKKNPVISDYSKARKFFKRLAAKRVRKAKEVPNGTRYRRYSDSWDISDWSYWWDPWPSVYFHFKTGEMKFLIPTPEWKVRMK